jgi:hypothetical protein
MIQVREMLQTDHVVYLSTHDDGRIDSVGVGVTSRRSIDQLHLVHD